MTTNVVRLFFEAAERNENTPAFMSASGATVRFGDLRRAVESFSASLTSEGLRAGDRVVFMLPMSPDLYIAVLGTLAAGGVAVFVDPWVSVRQIATLGAAASPIAFVGTPKAHLLRLFAVELRRVRITVATDGRGAGIVARHRFRDFATAHGTSAIANVPNDASALITYTTGSSGRPKGVNRTHGILAAQHHVIREEFPAEPGDVDMTTFPVFALSNLAAGITTVIPPVDLRRIADADGGAVFRDLRAFGVTTLAASPPLFDRLASHVHAHRASLPPVRRIVTGGAPVRSDQLRHWRTVFPQAEIVVAYGSSEAEPVASMSADARLSVDGSHPGFCAGAPVHAIRSRVIEISPGVVEHPHSLERGTIGELIVAGPHVCRDYVGADATTAVAENKIREADGTIWHRMGDTGYFDDEGRFWIVGRVHSTIRRGGANVHAQLVESEVRASDSRIRAVAALGLPDSSLGERLVVVIESDADIARDVRERLAASAKTLPIDELRVTRKRLPVDPRHNSKIDYAKLRRMLERTVL